MAKTVKTSGGKPVKKPVKKTSAAKEATEKIPGLNVGKTTGLRIGEYLNGLLMKIWKETKVTQQGTRSGKFIDEATKIRFAKAVMAEFPKKDHIQSFGSYLNYFNGGLHGYGVNDEPLPKEKRLLQVRTKKEKDE